MTPDGRDENFLLARARQGDLPAFEEVVRRHQRRVYGMALRIVRSHAVADDVAQEAFLRAWRGLDRFELSRPFGPWIGLVAANLAADHARSPVPHEDPMPEADWEIPALADDRLRARLDREAEEVLARALDDMPGDQRAVFVLRTVEEMSYREIAEALELSPGTVMSRLFRARERLARALFSHLGRSARRAGRAE